MAELPSPQTIEHADPTNRTDVLDGEAKLPSYVAYSREIREHLGESLNTEGWPTLPEVTSGEQFFECVQEAVNDRWRRHVAPLMREQIQRWHEAVPNDPKFDKARDLLSKPD